MDLTWINVADTAIKIGLGAVITGISGYIVLVTNQSHEFKKESQVRYFDLQNEKKIKFVNFLSQSQVLIQTHIDKIGDLESDIYLTYIKSFNEVQILVDDELRIPAYDVSSSVTTFVVWNKANPDQDIFDKLKLDALNKIGYFQKLAQEDVSQPYV